VPQWFFGFSTFRARIFWSIIPIVLSLLIFHGLMDLRQHRRLVEAEFVKRGHAMASNLAHSAELGVFAEDRELLESWIRGIVGDPDVAYVFVYGEDQKILASGGGQAADPVVIGAGLSWPETGRLASALEPIARHVQHRRARYIEFFAPVTTEEVTPLEELLIHPPAVERRPSDGKQRLIGTVRLGMALASVEGHVFALGRLWIGIGVVFFVLSTLAIYGFSRRITRPIKRLTDQAQQISAGFLDQTIAVESRDEIGRLAVAFNEMAGTLKGTIDEKQRVLDELRDLNRTLEDRIHQRTAELEEKSRQLEIANRHKSEFLANMSHELRTPLNAVIGFSEVLLERMFGDLNDKQEEYLQDILSSGRHLLALINDILDLSKVEAGRMELELTTFDLPTALKNTITLVRERATRHGIRLHLDVDDQLGEITADERKVKQVLLNLLSNAVKFTPDGGAITVRAAPSPGAVEIVVSDTGIGIAPEDQVKIFEEFQQVGLDYARKGEGSGLGLTLAKRFVELHGGRIAVASALGAGSTFTITLPAGIGSALDSRHV
jgi:signal transduction histidine kinase